MRVQSINDQRNYSKSPSFEAVKVTFIDNSPRPLEKIFKDAYESADLKDKDLMFKPNEYMKNFSESFSNFLSKFGIDDGEIKIARAYGPGVKENSLNATFELKNKHIQGPASFLAADLFKGQNNMNFEPVVKTFNENAPHTVVRWFLNSENPFRVFAEKEAAQKPVGLGIVDYYTTQKLRVKEPIGRL